MFSPEYQAVARPFSTKWGRCRAKPDGWGVESRNASSKARSYGRASLPGFEAAGHTPSGPPGHLPQQTGEGVRAPEAWCVNPVGWRGGVRVSNRALASPDAPDRTGAGTTRLRLRPRPKPFRARPGHPRGPAAAGHAIDSKSHTSPASPGWSSRSVGLSRRAASASCSTRAGWRR